MHRSVLHPRICLSQYEVEKLTDIGEVYAREWINFSIFTKRICLTSTRVQNFGIQLQLYYIMRLKEQTKNKQNICNGNTCNKKKTYLTLEKHKLYSYIICLQLKTDNCE